MFARKQRPYDSIPPTQADLREHAKLKRAAYQVGVIWGQATCANPDIGSPPDWGWIKTEAMWKVCWTKLTLPRIKTGGGDGGGRVEDVAIFIRSDKNGQDQE